MRSLFAVLLYIVSFNAIAQTTDDIKPVNDSLFPMADPKYREDQMYASVSYNLAQNAPLGYSQYSVPIGLTVGFMRDMPINKRRNRSIAIGFGYGYNNIKHNLLVGESEKGNTYETVSKTSFDRNKLVLHSVEVPLEFRWRTSNEISHQFWRIYAGAKLSYIFYDKAQVYYPEYSLKVKNDDNINKLMGGVYVAAGYNTWNLYAYYGITPLYNGPVMANGEKLKMHMLQLGLMFYIL